MDAVDPATFARITRVPGSFERVVRGIRAAQRAGLDPVKVNCVLLRGFNDDQIVPFAKFAREEGVIVRFIEFMPLEEDRLWTPDTVIPIREVIAQLESFRPVVRLTPNTPSETARALHLRRRHRRDRHHRARLAGLLRACSRVRLTSDGKIRTCLFSQIDHDLYGVMKRGGSDDGPRRIHPAHRRTEGSPPPHRRAGLPEALTQHGPHRRVAYRDFASGDTRFAPFVTGSAAILSPLPLVAEFLLTGWFAIAAVPAVAVPAAIAEAVARRAVAAEPVPFRPASTSPRGWAAPGRARGPFAELSPARQRTGRSLYGRERCLWSAAHRHSRGPERCGCGGRAAISALVGSKPTQPRCGSNASTQACVASEVERS